MENRTQPILCCVGADVAGQPTQFLMEKAALAGHLDWHVITVEVNSDQLAKAWDGMHVMQFQAVRFFPTHQANAMHLVTQPSADDQFIGGITSAMRCGDQWSMWHNSGPALVELLSQQLQLDSAVCWVHGNSSRVRSFLVACKANRPRQIFWTGAELAPKTITDAGASDELTSAETTQLLPEVLVGLPLEIVPKEREAELASALSSHMADDTTRSVVHAGEMDSKHLDILLAHQPEHTCALAIVSAMPGSRRKLTETWRSGEVIVLSPGDLVVAEEAYDQARWTGQPTNIDLLREAYEEYVDF